MMIHFEQHNLELFILSASFFGAPGMGNLDGLPDEHFIRDVRFLSRHELQDIVVYPELLKSTFWDDLEEGFPRVRYLGKQVGNPPDAPSQPKAGLSTGMELDGQGA